MTRFVELKPNGGHGHTRWQGTSPGRLCDCASHTTPSAQRCGCSSCKGRRDPIVSGRKQGHGTQYDRWASGASTDGRGAREGAGRYAAQWEPLEAGFAHPGSSPRSGASWVAEHLLDPAEAVATQADDPVLPGAPFTSGCNPSQPRPSPGAQLDPDGPLPSWDDSLGRCQPDFSVWMNAYRREGKINLPERALARDPSMRAWCVSLGESADGNALATAVPIEDAVRLTERPRSAEEDILSLAGAIGDAARDTRVRATVSAWADPASPISNRYSEPPGLFFDRGPIRGTLELALRVVAATSDFFDSSPMDKMTACTWSGSWVRDVLGSERPSHAGNGSGSWSSGRGPLKIYVHYPTIEVPGARGERPFPHPGGAPAPAERSPNAAEGCPGSVVRLNLYREGDANLTTTGFEADEGVNTFVARTIGARTLWFCNWSRIAEKAVMADYYFWLARLLNDWATMSGTANRRDRRLAELAAKQGFAQVVAMAGDLVHELGHLACDPTAHCCDGDGCPRGSGPARRNDCGTDLPRLLWWFWITQTKDLPMPWPPAMRTTAAGNIGNSLTTDLVSDLGLPRRTSTWFPSGPYSRSAYWHLGRSVGPHCGCENNRVLDERRKHPRLALSPTLASGGSPKSRCGYYYAFVQDGRRTLLTYSFNPLCGTSPGVHPTDSVVYWNDGTIQRTEG